MEICSPQCTGPWLSSHVSFPRNQILATQLRPCLVSSPHRPALILYGRPCDRNHCLVHRTVFLQGWCLSPIRVVFVFGLGGPHPGSSHRRLVPSSAPIDCLATIRTQEP